MAIIFEWIFQIRLNFELNNFLAWFEVIEQPQIWVKADENICGPASDVFRLKLIVVIVMIPGDCRVEEEDALMEKQ